jgi:hypothetical protein
VELASRKENQGGVGGWNKKQGGVGQLVEREIIDSGFKIELGLRKKLVREDFRESGVISTTKKEEGIMPGV